MTRRRRQLDDLRDRLDAVAASHPTGFHHYVVGRATDAGGFYRWDPAAGVYVNDEHGDTLPPEAAPSSEFEFVIEATDGGAGA